MKYVLAAFLLAGAIAVPGSRAADLRLGIIGLDTSHCAAFTEILNNADAKNHIAGARVVAAYKGGSEDIPSSRDRVEGFTKTLQEKHGVQIVDKIEDLCAKVDAVLLESVDGRPHLEQARIVIAAGKPLFIDKPMAGSLRDALEIFRLAREKKVPVFSASSLRFGKATQEVRNGSVGAVTYAEASSPASLEPHHPDLFWYGIHGVESLFTVMGPGCVSVRRGATTDGRIEVTGTWKDGRTGIFRELAKGYGGVAKGAKGEAPIGAYDGYAVLVEQIVKFFQTGVSPVPERETIEILAFMEAADESKKLGGKEVKIEDIIARAQAPAK